MRIAGKTAGALAGDQKLYQLRMSLVKLHLRGGNSFQQIDSLFIVVVFALGQPDQQLKIAGLPH